MGYKKKLNQVALPLETINAASSREKSIHGHPSTLHLWWARRSPCCSKGGHWSSQLMTPQVPRRISHGGSTKQRTPAIISDTRATCKVGEFK